MPNHVHAIIIFDEPSILLEDTYTSRIPDRFKQNRDDIDNNTQLGVLRTPSNRTTHKELPTLGEVARTLKAACTYRIRKTIISDFGWESRLYEHVIRNTADLTRIQTYIINNPASWEEDTLHPS